MRIQIIATAALVLGSAAAGAQEIVKVKASEANVSRPDDMFALPPGQWFVSKLISQGNEPCTPDACEAGFHSGDLVVSVEHAKEWTRVIAGFRNCEAVAFQEAQTGNRPGSAARGEVSNLLKKVVKAAEKSCSARAPEVPKLDIKSLYPAKVG
ncbi:hypothetical protein G7076_06340 [Sphingomonas sp. HDW15A]|uniref:hypothetical protein n=1 Tax=Sphingomonas sp. HDW15A TaxID=2714942 RepID=UPI00140B7A1D|nr:hypothetical protein [Sphingomonas sp. HDW15A]QIK96117.1 hypothetical protein G7076_06340 [Sphingomonas sp. HDW15A]